MGSRLSEMKRQLQKGMIIFNEGDKGDSAYIIDKGRVEIYVGENDEMTPIAVLGVGEIFGEMAIIDGSDRSASAIALEDCELTVVSQDQLAERIRQSDPIVRLLIIMLIKRNRENIKKNYPNSKAAGNVTPISKHQNYSSHFEESNADAIERIKFEKELENALDCDDFQLYYQPVIDMISMRIAGFEALIRWNSPSRGMVRPDIFMGIAEETSLIIPIGQWVIQRACKDRASIMNKLNQSTILNDEFFMAVNVSGRQLQDPDLFQILDESTRKYNVPANKFKLELTERVFMNGNYIEEWIKECRSKGYQIALDDFGTGYSSLGYISKFSVDNLKIDRSFILKMHDDHKTLIIIQAILQIAKGLNIPVIAEGIETEADAIALKNLDCRLAQGYLFAKPMPLNDLLEFLEQDKIKTDVA